MYHYSGATVSKAIGEVAIMCTWYVVEHRRMKWCAYTGLIAVAMDLTKTWSAAGLGTSRLSTSFHGAPAASTITPFILIVITIACIMVLKILQ